MIHLYIGDGKGKTTAAVGLALRARGRGKKVCFVQFLKAGRTSGEITPLKKAGVKIVRFSQKHPMFCKNISMPTLKTRIQKDVIKVNSISRSKKFNLVILDEILCALKNKFVTEKSVLEIMQNCPKSTELVLTGPVASSKISKYADYISKVKCIKHPHQKGVKARIGIEM